MSSLEALQFFTVCIGITVTIVPASYAAYFWHTRSGIGRVMAYMLTGEAISMSIAVYFAYNSYVGSYNTMSPEIAMMLRWLIFFTTGLSTLKLIFYITKVKAHLRWE